ncbi:hypothetical protein L6452_20197 [Arctium lappa]|uniref:Uncharacterized protein n=1 Tax=Arctium lappa TaxID=4217 RepID=A0ACB9BAP2_ARCLA|nr:hypothetical protein L6452_20197 [Arctium lappa]
MFLKDKLKRALSQDEKGVQLLDSSYKALVLKALGEIEERLEYRTQIRYFEISFVAVMYNLFIVVLISVDCTETGIYNWYQSKETKGPNLILKGRELEAENSELKGKILEAKTQQIVSVESSEEKISVLKDANAELQKRLSDLEQLLAKHKSHFEIKEKSFAKKFSEFSRKCADEKKEVELKCIKLSQQVSAFEKLIILEREKFAKEKKAIEQKNVGFFK